MNKQPIDDLARNAYVDERMDAAQRREMDAYLATHPDEARNMAGWRRDTQRLRATWGEYAAMPPNPALDPSIVRTRMRGRKRARLATAAGLVLVLTAGGVSGWQIRDRQFGLGVEPMQDAVQAYRVFASGHVPVVDVRAADANLQQWMDSHFANAQRLPDLGANGFRPVAARLLVTDQGPSAIVIYENGDGQRASFYIRPPGPGSAPLKQGQRRDRDLLARYWSGEGYNYALVSRGGAPGIAAGRAKG